MEISRCLLPSVGMHDMGFNPFFLGGGGGGLGVYQIEILRKKRTREQKSSLVFIISLLRLVVELSF